MQAFVAGAWNPELKRAGFAVLMDDGSFDACCPTVEGALDCGRASNADKAELLGLKAIDLLLAVTDSGNTAIVHMSSESARQDALDMAADGPYAARTVVHGLEFNSYDGISALLHFSYPDTEAGNAGIQACLDLVRKMATAKAFPDGTEDGKQVGT